MPEYPEATYRRLLSEAVEKLARIQAESAAQIAELEAQILHLQTELGEVP